FLDLVLFFLCQGSFAQTDFGSSCIDFLALFRIQDGIGPRQFSQTTCEFAPVFTGQLNRIGCIQVDRSCQVKKSDTGEKIKSERMNVSCPTAGIEIVSQLPWSNEKQPDRFEEFGVPIKERICCVNKNTKE